jgi:YidC/Oxa1 family membrane protein insertase
MKNNLNVVFAIAFLFGFVYLWDVFVMSRYSGPRAPAPAATPSAEAPATAASPAIRTASANPVPVNPVPAANDAIISLKTDNSEVVMLAQGARVGSWKLREKDHWLELVMPEKSRNTSPLETFPDLSFSSRKVSDSEVVFTARHPAGFDVRKTVSLLAAPPFHRVTLEISNPSKAEIVVNTRLGWGNGLDKHPVDAPYDKDAVTAENRAAALGQKVMSWRPGFVFGRNVERTETGTFQWVAVDNHHFLAALTVPEGQTIPRIYVSVNRDHAPVAAAVIDGQLKPGESLRRDYLLFVGPKNGELLEKAGHGLSQAIDYGMFGFISKGLLAALHFFHDLTKNYGWAIVLLTLCIQVLLFPLTKKSLDHAVKMKELQPHLKRLQEQFKEDPKRYQIEMMNFYKKNGMRFMGLEGCLPMLLQMPVFFAFYATLNNAYELRGADWILWVTDLAAKDPYYVLPIVMGAGMFVQQKMSGTTLDPAQARMMTIMPIIFTFMFLSMPAGLVLYWVVNSMVTIIIQKILTWTHHRHPPAVAV